MPKFDIPAVGDKIPQDRIMYFFGGTVKHGRIVVTQKDRDWYFGECEEGEEFVYVINSDTPKQFQMLGVIIDSNNIVTRLRNGGYFKKTELECIRTPGMRQDIGEPVMGMFTHNKDDSVTVLRAMKQAIFEEINEQQKLIDEMESVIENS